MSTISTALKTARQVHFLLDLEFTGLSLRLAHGDLVVPSSFGENRRYEAAITKTFEVGPRLDLRTFRYGAVSVSIEIANRDRFQDLEKICRLDGGIGTIRVWCDGLTWEDILVNGVLFKGVFQKQYHNKTTYAFDLVDLARYKLDTLPPEQIDQNTWPYARTAGGSGDSPLGQPGQIVFGDFPPVLPAPCVAVNDGGHWFYLATYGLTVSREAQFEAGTELLLDKDGATIDPVNYTYYEAADHLGNPCQYFEFAADQAALEPLRFSVQGIRDGSGEYTGIAAGIIEHPADIVRFILEKFSQLYPEDVDAASLKTAKAILPGIAFSVMVNDSARGMDVVDRLLSQCLAVRILRPGGLMGVWTFCPEAPAIGRIIRDQDVIGNDMNPVTFTKTPEDFVVNNLAVKYALNPLTKAWGKTLTKNRNNDPRCKQSFYQYGEQPRFEWLLTDVQRDYAAAACANRFLDLRAMRHDVVEFDVPWFTGFDFIQGDAGLLTLEEGPSLDGAGWVEEKCVLIERIFRPTTIRQKWMRVSSE